MTTIVIPQPHTGSLSQFDQLADFTQRWLENRRFSDNTRDAYHRDVNNYLLWCQYKAIDPLSAQFTHLNTYGRELETPHPETGRALSAASAARKLSAISSWYSFLVKLGAIPTNPAQAADRPTIDRDHTATIGFDADEARALLKAGRTDPYLGDECAELVTQLMVGLGARVSELCSANLEDLGYDSGHRTILLRLKGNKRRQRAIPPPAIAALDRWLTHRGNTSGPLLINKEGERLNRQRIYRFCRRVARKANLPSAARITPHSFRHAWATIARQAGASLEARQDALGHADPRTTQRYDRARFRLDVDPSYLVSAAVADV